MIYASSYIREATSVPVISFVFSVPVVIFVLPISVVSFAVAFLAFSEFHDSFLTCWNIFVYQAEELDILLRLEITSPVHLEA